MSPRQDTANCHRHPELMMCMRKATTANKGDCANTWKLSDDKFGRQFDYFAHYDAQTLD